MSLGLKVFFRLGIPKEEEHRYPRKRPEDPLKIRISRSLGRLRAQGRGLALQLARVAGKVFCQLLLQARQGLGLGNRVMQALKGNPSGRYTQAIFSIYAQGNGRSSLDP